MARDGVCDKLCFTPCFTPWVGLNEYKGLRAKTAYAVVTPCVVGVTAYAPVLRRVTPCGLELFKEWVIHLFSALCVGLSGCLSDYMVDRFGAFFDFGPHGVEADRWVDVEFF